MVAGAEVDSGNIRSDGVGMTLEHWSYLNSVSVK